MKYLESRRRRARRLSAGAQRQGRHRSPCRRLQRGRAQPVHHDGVRAAACAAPEGRNHRPARGADRRRRGAHLRHADAVPPGRHLLRASASSTSPRTTRSCSTTAKRRTGRSWRRASPRRARCRPGSPRPRRTRRTARRCCRSTSTTRCSASSASATSSGRRPTRARAASCSAARRGAPRSPARACSTRTAPRTSSPRRFPTAAPTTRASATSSPRSSQDGARRMLEAQEDVFYYVTVANENYAHPAMPPGAAEGILQRDVPVAGDRAGNGSATGQRPDPARSACGGGAAREGLGRRSANVWSVTSFTELRRDGMEAERTRRLGGEAESWVEKCLKRHERTGHRRERLRERGGRPHPAVCARASMSRSAPTASAAAIRAPRCARSSRWTRATSRWPRSPRWGTPQSATRGLVIGLGSRAPGGPPGSGSGLSIVRTPAGGGRRSTRGSFASAALRRS